MTKLGMKGTSSKSGLEGPRVRQPRFEKSQGNGGEGDGGQEDQCHFDEGATKWTLFGEVTGARTVTKGYWGRSETV